MGRPKHMTTEQRFWEKVDKSGDCWLWTGGRTGQGYGRFAVTCTRDNVKLVLPHRYSWELVNGPIPGSLQVLHSCDTPPCVRPDHLMLGTPRANTRDAIAKGRFRPWGRRPAA